MSQKQSIGIGIIGSGFARTTQLPGFVACAGARVVAIASAHLERAEKVAGECGIEFATDDWREVVARPDVDLVSIVTWPATHAEMTLAALDAGKAVLCEKPTAMNAEEAERMLRRAEELDALALIDHELRFLPARLRMRDLIRAGEIGRVRHAKYLFRSDSRAASTRPWNWWSDAAQGGGTLGAIGSHAVDSLRWLLQTEVSHVGARLATHTAERMDEASGQVRPVTSDDEANLILRLEDASRTGGTTATVSMSMVEQGKPLHRVEIFGETGALCVDGSDLFRSATGEGDWSPVETKDVVLARDMHDNEWSRGFTLFSRAIVEALREGQKGVPEAATFRDGYRTQLVLDYARRAHESGKMEEIGAA